MSKQVKKKTISLGAIIKATQKLERRRVKKAESSIRARLTIYGHSEMSNEEFKFFKKWLTIIVPSTASAKRGDLSKVFRQTLYKNNG